MSFMKNLINFSMLYVLLFQAAHAYDMHDFFYEVNSGQTADFNLGTASVTEPGLSFLIQPTLPNQGRFDYNHLPYGFNVPDDTSRAAFAIRTVAVFDFLATRLALKSLIGDDRLTSVSSSYQIPVTLTVPQVTKSLMGYGTSDPIHPASELIDSIENKRHPYNRSKREAMVAMLVYVSTELVKVDMQMKFLNEDIWDNPNFTKQYNDLVRENYENSGLAEVDGLSASLAGRSLTLKSDLKKKFQALYHIPEKLDELVAQREIFLDQYRILGMQLEGQPLYTHIYNLLVAQGFPSLSIDQTVKTNMFPNYSVSLFDPLSATAESNNESSELYLTSDNTTHEMEMPVVFSSEVAANLPKLNSSEFVKFLVWKLSGNLDKLFLQMLQANTKALERYSKSVSYGSDPQLYKDLAQFSHLWEKAKDYFSYLHLEKEFAQGRKIIESQISQQQSRKETLQMVFVGLGLALFAGAAVASWGATTPLAGFFGISAWLATLSGTLMTVSGAVAAVASVYAYCNQKNVADKLNLFYLAGRTMNPSSSEVEGALKMEQVAFRGMIIALFMSGLPGKVVFGVAGKFSSLGSKAIISAKAVSPFLRRMTSAVARLSGLTFLSKFTKSLVSQIETEILVSRGLKDEAFVQWAITQAQKIAGVSREEIIEGMMNTPYVGKKIQAIYQQHLINIQNNPYYVSETLQNIRADLMIMTATRYLNDPDNFREEWPYLVTSAVSTFIIGWGINFSLASNLKTGLRVPGFLEVTATLKPNAYKMATWGMIGGFVGSVSGESLEMALSDTDDTAKTERIERILYTTLFYGAAIGISSNLRSTYISGWISPRIRRNMAIAYPNNPTMAVDSYKRIYWGISYGNNIFGTGVSLFALEKFDIQKNNFTWDESIDIDGSDEGPMPYYVTLYDDRSPEDYLIPAFY